ncbi:outer membrane beta-barrel protein [Defluviimonas sp. WL0002]|uniref:Outer membrane beta-barrel protein n=1 Tax=Albidovulum marisflavi TaxID=2984159 RepID=A0ABT2ZF78_9RHOB|nr:OmpW family outer membrane protein [Defluviimonas sp. WL0002]MCV2869774.1 outer membrane beta-barrel protein [Defluviimonas sp. WL0002]
MKLTLVPALIALVAAAPACAQSAGDWTVGVGLGWVSPKGDNGLLAGQPTTVDNDMRPTITVEYFPWDNIGIELLAATPFEHTATISGVGTATTKHLPPTLSLVYHIPTAGKITPFVGAGLNYTTFFSEESALGNVKLDDSFGLAVKAGFDVAISDKGALRTEVRWMDIDTDASLNGAYIGTAEIDPVVFGVSYVMKF